MVAFNWKDSMSLNVPSTHLRKTLWSLKKKFIVIHSLISVIHSAGSNAKRKKHSNGRHVNA